MPTTVRFLGPDSVKVDSKEKVPADVKETKMKETKMKETKMKETKMKETKVKETKMKETKMKGKKVNPKDDAKDKVKKPVKNGGKMKKT
jgi:RNA polymerase primary sigma factor